MLTLGVDAWGCLCYRCREFFIAACSVRKELGMPQRRDAAIVGINEYPLRVTGGGVSSLQIKAACAAKALEDAGLSWQDVDAVYDTGGDQNIGGLGIAE